MLQIVSLVIVRKSKLPSKEKIFGIGFHKTGTTSLSEALKLLGFSVTGPNGINDPNIAVNASALASRLVPKFDAFQDNPWPILYKELYSDFPDAKFILTYRDPQSWIESQVRHFGKQQTPMRKWIYGKGCPEGNERTYLKRYQKHNRDVVSYFKKKGKRILLMDLEKGHGWVELCQYLEVDIPDVTFPHANKAETREKSLANKR